MMPGIGLTSGVEIMAGYQMQDDRGAAGDTVWPESVEVSA